LITNISSITEIRDLASYYSPNIVGINIATVENGGLQGVDMQHFIFD
jgi:hypothetical protein